MEGRDGIEIKRGDRRARPANSSKLEKILKLTWEGARGGRGHLDLLILIFLINIPVLGFRLWSRSEVVELMCYL